MKSARFKLFCSLCILSVLLPALFSTSVAQQKGKETSIINNGKLANQFYLYEEELDNFYRDTYVWNGKYYALQPKLRRKLPR